MMRSTRPNDAHTHVRVGRAFVMLVTGLGMVAGPSACQLPTGPRIKVFLFAEPPAHPEMQRPIDRITLAGAIGETVSVHLALSAIDKPIDGITVELDPLASPHYVIPADAITLYRSLAVELEAYPGWHVRLIPPSQHRGRIPDVLVPLDAAPLGPPWSIAPDEPNTLWVDVHIPDNTRPGRYEATLSIGRSGNVLASIPVSLTVWPFKLPDHPDGALIAPLDHQAIFRHHVTLDGQPYDPLTLWGDGPLAAELDGLLNKTMVMLQAHMLTPVLHRLRPIVKLGSGEQVRVDWTEYDRVAGPYLDGDAFENRVPLFRWPIPLDDTFPMRRTVGEQSSPASSRMLQDYLADAAEHFASRGWLERCYVELPGTRTLTAAGHESAAYFGPIIKAADARLPRMVGRFPQDMAPFGWEGFPYEPIGEYVDIWCPPAQYFDVQTMEREVDAGRERWFQADRPPFSGSVSIAAASPSQRSLAWQMYRYHAAAVMLPPINHWPGRGEPVSAQRCLSYDENTLIYPGSVAGTSEPLPSVRLKQLRRGMQDLAYVRLLESLGGGHVAEVLAESLVPFAVSDAYGAHFSDGRAGGWERDPAVWSLARRILAEEIRRRIAGPAGQSPQQVTHAAVEWRRFLEATRQVDLRVDGVRVRETGPASLGAVVIECIATVSNRTRKPLEGRLRFGDLPVGWQSPVDGVAIETIAPGRTRRVVLRADTGVMTWSRNSVQDLPMVLETIDEERQTYQARLAFLAAATTDHPIRLDGDLSDWPGGAGNQAGDFVLISADGGSVNRSESRPRSRTEVMVARDRDYLYFAFNCYADSPWTRSAVRRSYVQYEDGIPVGEELVEILIDPYNAGTRDTGDLYHVVFTSSGSLCERGVGTDPPTGRREVWAADVQHAVAYHDDRWVVEARIPMAAFDAHARRQRIWGINFTRFDAVHQEFSTWSGAQQNAYDPLALGNLVIPEL
ncbi:MAG: DUF4091 domain-containing protein [Planctomycetes bacterium]|nr:DUF4091 domain-containing protein [Planctomycetota bacterium]